MTEVFAIDRREDGIAVVRIDVPGERQNILQAEFAGQANELLDELDRDRALKGVIIASGKPDSFIAGADIRMLAACQSADEAAALARAGQAFCQRIADFRVPVVAAIDGVCLGGGLELALACHGRICSDRPATRFGLPEVRLGLLPGSGATQRLPRLIGLPQALDLMLSGRHIRASQAVRMGLIDEAVPGAILLEVAYKNLSKKRRNRVKNSYSRQLMQIALEKIPKARSWFFEQVRKRVRAKTQDHTGSHYPAPERIIECVQTGLAAGFAAGLECEARCFGELAMTAQARQLINIYFTTVEMKKDPGISIGIDNNAMPRPIKKIAVIGAGLMGAGISYVSASRAAVAVRLKDIDSAALSRGLKTIHKLIQQRLQKRALTVFEAGQQQQRITPTVDYSGFHNIDIVIEAVFEDLALKQQILLDIEQHTHPETIFASNTSSIPIARIAEAAARPANIIGMHYFSPVEKMPLLEVIATPQTSAQTIMTAMAFGRRQGKTVIAVKDSAGFYVNRILAPYINEAGLLLEESVAIDMIDRALVQFGFPLGPFTLLDEVGIDVGAKVAAILHEAFGARMKPAGAAERMLAAGRKGKKCGKGFYRYRAKRNKEKTADKSVYALLGVRADKSMAAEKISERCVLLMLNEAARCLEENVIRSVRDGDIGAVFGIGFPPFLGGPFRYMDSLGIEQCVARLQAYQKRLGERFQPAAVLLDMAGQGRLFYQD